MNMNSYALFEIWSQMNGEINSSQKNVEARMDMNSFTRVQ